MKNNNIQKTMNFIGLLGASFTQENKNTLEQWLKLVFTEEYKKGVHDGLQNAKEIYGRTK